MDTFYLVCFAIGGTVMLAQMVLTIIGIGEAHTDADFDAPDDHDASWFFGVLSIRAMVASLTFFGLGGLSAGYYHAEEPARFAAASAAALASLYGVSFVMRQLGKLKSDGTARLANAVGGTGTVYLRIPAGKTGHGKVTLTIQSRSVEVAAITLGPEIPTGTPVTVIAVPSPDTVEVIAA